ncbi:MAG: phosphoribosylanthranilate isomerase [Pseudomonadota bacterium]
MTIQVKICGLTSAAAVDAVARAGAAYAGFVHFPPSPRHLEVQALGRLVREAPAGLAKVLLTVDADDALLDAILEVAPLDILQLQGGETPERVAEVRARYGLPVMKAVGVRDAGDLAALDDHGRAADLLLVDAKPPPGGALPGGNGLTFDWRLIAGRRWPVPWMLAGGLNAANAAEAVRATGARQLDVSSSVERAPGVKDPDLVRAFVEAVSAAEPSATSAAPQA